MSEIDYANGWDFIDAAEGIPRQLRFSRDWAPTGDPRVFSGTGQLVAVVANADRPDFGDTVPISRPNVSFDEVEAAVAGWQTWAKISPKKVDLAAIRQRITAAGLGMG